MFAAPLSMTTTLLTPVAQTASGKSKRYTPGIFVASTSTNPPEENAPVTVCVASVITVAEPSGRT